MASLFHRVLLPSVLLSGAIFSATVLPLVSVPEEPVLVEFQGQPVFQGNFEELAVPYLGLATVLSLGVGLTSATLLGWQLSGRKSAHTAEQLSMLQRDLQEKEALIESLRFSDTRLQSSTLGRFLDAEEPMPQATPQVPMPTSSQAATPFTVIYNEKNSEPHRGDVVSFTSDVAVLKPEASSTVLHLPTPLQSGSVVDSKSTSATSEEPILDKVRMALPGAQAYNGYLRQVRPEAPDVAPTSAQPQTVTELLHQIKMLMAEVEKHSTAEKRIPETHSSVSQVA